MKKNNPILLIEAMLSEKDDIFNTLLCRTAKCAADVWDYLPQDLQEEIRERIWKAWLGWARGKDWVEETALSILGRVDKELLKQFFSALKDEDLKDKDSVVRMAAAEALGEIGTQEVVSEFIKMLKDGHWFVQWAAVRTLGRIGDKEAIPELIKALKYEHWFVREAAARALGRIGAEEAIPELIKTLKDGDSNSRVTAGRALKEIGSQEVVSELIKCLKDEDIVVRWLAALALGEIGAQEAVPELIKWLKGDDSEVRWIAADALGEFGAQEAVPELIRWLKDNNDSWRVIGVREEVVVALGKAGTEPVIKALYEQLKRKPERYLWESLRIACKKANVRLYPDGRMVKLEDRQ